MLHSIAPDGKVGEGRFLFRNAIGWLVPHPERCSGMRFQSVSVASWSIFRTLTLVQKLRTCTGWSLKFCRRGLTKVSHPTSTTKYASKTARGGTCTTSSKGLYKLLLAKRRINSAFGAAINEALVSQNIGWQLDGNGQVVTRGDEAFERTTKSAVAVLEGNAKPTAAGHLRSAISALSERPKANTSGAVAQATSAVECVLGEITGGKGMSLGKYLDKHPKLFHPALKKGLDGIYGYASSEGARHGVEGTEPSRDEADFAVAVCAAVCTLLTQRHPK
jgi:hypothetical protein